MKIAREIIGELRGAVAGVQVSPPFGRLPAALAVLAADEQEALAILAAKA